MALAFDSHGSGPALVLLHGIGSHRGMWDPVVGNLARERRVIAVDLPGFAGSATEQSDPSPAGLTDAMQRWFAEQGLDRPHVAGNSLGGGIALELARRHAVASATALSPIGFWTPRELAFAQHSLRAARGIVKRLRPAIPVLTSTAVGRVALFSQIYGRPWRLPPDDAQAAIEAFLDGPAFEPVLEAAGHYRFGAGDELRGVPVTIAWGTRDALLIPRQAARARRLLPWAQHVALRGCGHVPCHDDPEAVAAVLLAGSRDG
ncbi:MAG: alpha/beta fold hydrolase [Solirubrobacteraceae bacterium]